MNDHTRGATNLAAALIALALAAAPGAAHADQLIIRNAGQPTIQRFEIEPHGTFGWRTYHGRYLGFGAGVRASITLSQRAFVPSINNSVAISFGGDLTFYQDCYWRYDNSYSGYGGGCGTTILHLPVALQWNFFISQRWSVFVEPGLALNYGFWDDPCDRGFACDPRFYRPSHLWLDFAGWIGGRFHFNDHVALTFRIGYPTASVGVSFY